MKRVALFIFIFTIQTRLVKCMANAGPVGDLKLFYVTPCEPPVEDDEIVFETYLESVGEDDKALNLRVKLPFDIDDSVVYAIIADKWENGDFQKDTYKLDGVFFDMVNKYIPKIWTHFRSEIEPNIEDTDMIKAGEYVLKNFQDMADNIDFPQILYGRFRVTAYLTKDDKDIVCRFGEIESIARSQF